MLFGSINNNKTYVAAASRTEELKVFGEYMQNMEQSKLFKDIHKPDFIELMQDDNLKGYSIAYVFSHENENQAEEFCAAFNVSIVHKKELKDKHVEMLEASDVNIDPYLSPDADKRPIGEIYGIDNNDPWDARTPEQIAKADDERMSIEQMRKEGKLTGESFSAPTKNKKGISLIDAGASIDEFGNVKIDSATYMKLGEETESSSTAEIVLGGIIADFTGVDRQKRFSANIPEIETIEDEAVLYIVESDLITKQMVLEPKLNRHKNSGAQIFYNDTMWAITREPSDAAKLQAFIELAGRKVSVFPVNKNGELNVTAKTEYDETAPALAFNLGHDKSIYFRIDVSKKFINAMYMLSKVIDILMKDEILYDKMYATGVSDKGAWIVSRSMLSLEQIVTHLKEHQMEVTSAYAVNDWGDRLVEVDDVNVVDPNAQQVFDQPRPWNGRMEEFLALGDGDIEKAWKKVKGKELIFCALPMEANEGTLIYITPAEYFLEHKEAWDGHLPIDHLISPDMKPVKNSTNTYRSLNREESAVSQELGKKGMKENLLFNLYINNIL